MSTTQEQINENTTKINSIISQSKSIGDLTEKTSLDGTEEIPIGGEQKITVQSILENISSEYTIDQLNSAIRKTLTPYSYSSYLPDDTPYTTPSIVASTPTKVLIPTTIKSSNEWAVAEVSTGNFAVQYTGATTESFKINMSTSMTTGTNNVVVEIFMYKNGVLEPGVAIGRKVGTGSDVGAIAVTGEFSATPNDYVEVYVKVDLASTITFDKTAIIITEVN